MDKLELSNTKVKEEMTRGYELFKKKNADYNNSFFEALDEMDAFHNIKRKYARVESVFTQGKELKIDETIEDTLTDLGNYCFMTLAKIRKKQYDVYLASGWFNENQAKDLEDITNICKSLNMNIFSPKEECVCPPNASISIQEKVFRANVDAIKNCKFVIVNTRDKDLGTIFEAGAAFEMDKPIIYYCVGLKGHFNLMLSRSGRAVATTTEELKEHIVCMMKDINYSCDYKGVIE